MVQGISGNPNIQQAQPNIPGGSRLGNHTIWITGNPPLSLDKLGTEKIPFQGFTSATRKERAKVGVKQSITHALNHLSWSDGKVDPASVARSMNTVQNYLQREVNLGTITSAQVNDAFMAHFASAISQMSNQQLNSAYQGLISRSMQDLVAGLRNELAAGENNEELRNNLSELFHNISRLELLFAQEISNRVVVGNNPAEARNIPTLTSRYPIPRANDNALQNADGALHMNLLPGELPLDEHYVGANGDMSTKSLQALTTRGAIQSNKVASASVATDTRMQTHGFDAVSTRELGNILRSSELTINVGLDSLIGEGFDLPPENPALTHDNSQDRNQFVGRPSNIAAQRQFGQIRNQTESAMFPNPSNAQVNSAEHPHYGALNVQNKVGGPASEFGDCVVVLKESVKQQCTYTLKDNFKALPAKVDNEAKERFVANLVAHKEDFSDETQAQLEDPTSELRQIIDHSFLLLQNSTNVALDKVEDPMEAMVDEVLHPQDGASESAAPQNSSKVTPSNSANITLDDVMDLMESQLKNYLYPRGGAPGDADRMRLLGYLTEPLADREAAANLGVTYDNMELLFAQMKDFDLFYTEQMAAQLHSGNASGVQVGGTGYIEAQILAPLTMQDVQEIRIDRSKLAARYEQQFSTMNDHNQDRDVRDYREEHNLDEFVSDEKVKAMIINDKVNARLDSLQAFANSVGVKLEITESSSEVDALIENANIAASSQAKDAAAKALEEEFAAFANEFALQSLDKLQNRFIAAMPPALATYLETKFGQLNLDALPADVQDIFRQVLMDSAKFAVRGAPESQDQVLTQMFDRAASVFHSRLVMLDEMAKLNFDDPGKRHNFQVPLLGKINSGSIAAEQVPTLVQNTFKLHTVCHDVSTRERLARTVLDSLAAKSAAARLRAAIGDGPIFVGSTAEKVSNEIEKVLLTLSDSITKTHPDRLITDEEIEAELTRRVIDRAVTTKASLLHSANYMPFAGAADKAAFEAWILRTGDLSVNVDVEYVHSASNKILEIFEENLEGAFTIDGIANMLKAYVESMQRTYSFSTMTVDPISPEELNDHLSHAFSVAVSRYIARHGDAAMTAIDNLVRSPQTHRLHRYLQGMVDNSRLIDTMGARVAQGRSERETATLNMMNNLLMDIKRQLLGHHGAEPFRPAPGMHPNEVTKEELVPIWVSVSACAAAIEAEVSRHQ